MPRSIAVNIAALALFTSCASLNDPSLIGRSAEWYRRADPRAFFETEKTRGAVYFIGLYSAAAGVDSQVPGVSMDDPQFSPYLTWFAPSHAIADPAKNREFLDAVERFAELYNPLVLRHLKTKAHAK